MTAPVKVPGNSLGSMCLRGVHSLFIGVIFFFHHSCYVLKAHKRYEEALSGGYQAYLLEEDKCSRDVFCCNVGNLQPGSKVSLTLRYVQELPLEDDGALCYVLPAILNPRYHLSGECLSLLDTCH